MSICFAVLLLTTVTFTGTLAYTTSRNSTVDGNIPSGTAGAVLCQQQRIFDDDGNVIGLEALQNNKLLYPIVESAQYNGQNFDKYGMPMAENYVDQIVRVTNAGSEKIYARVIVAIPAALDDENEAGNNALHWNLGNRFMPEGDFGSAKEVNPAFSDITWKYSETAFVNGVKSNIYIFTYNTPLEAGETTAAAAFVGFYLDSDVDIVNDHIMLDGIDTGYEGASINIPVVVQGVQSNGFENAEAAFATGADNPWNTVTP